MKRIVFCLLFFSFVMVRIVLEVSGSDLSEGYRSPTAIQSFNEKLHRDHEQLVRLHRLTQTPGGLDLILIEIGLKTASSPAILIAANMDGDCPMASEAALTLCENLVTDWRDMCDGYTWFILPVGNPDGYARFFESPLSGNFVNARSFNEDYDDATDEDGPEDLNGDGFITIMRQPHPEGTWLSVENNPLLLYQADPARAQKGMYRLFSEGFDNDGDGMINEDGPGGFIPGHNFPHNFEYGTATGGPWPVSEKETRVLLRFAFDHPEIAMVITLGRSNSLLNVPTSSTKTAATQEKYHLPEHMAEEIGIDPEIEFTMPELIEMGKEKTGYEGITEEMVLQFLGLGVAINPDSNDLPYWNEISKKYKTFLEEQTGDENRLPPPDFSTGSFEEWAYYHFGVHSFSMDFWTLPVVKDAEEDESQGFTADKLATMSSDDFLALDADTFDDFLRKHNAPSQYSAEMIFEAVQAGQMTPQQIAEYLGQADAEDDGPKMNKVEQALYAFNPQAFIEWQSYDHPTLGEVEIGGKKPYYDAIPPICITRERISSQLPFIKTLVSNLPALTIGKIKIEKVGPAVWKIEVWLLNNGYLPFPTYQGHRCKRPAPAIVTLEPKKTTVIEGRLRRVLGVLPGSGGTEKITWLISGTKGQTLDITLESQSAGSDKRSIKLEQGGAS